MSAKDHGHRHQQLEDGGRGVHPAPMSVNEEREGTFIEGFLCFAVKNSGFRPRDTWLWLDDGSIVSKARGESRPDGMSME